MLPTCRVGSEVDGPQPNRDNTKFILFLKTGKAFIEVAAGSEEAANEWINEAKAFSGRFSFSPFRRISV